MYGYVRSAWGCGRAPDETAERAVSRGEAAAVLERTGKLRPKLNEILYSTSTGCSPDEARPLHFPTSGGAATARPSPWAVEAPSWARKSCACDEEICV